jgi:anti-anti-sigma factor
MSVQDRHDADVVSSVGPLQPTADGRCRSLDVRIRFDRRLPLVRLRGELELASQHLLTDAVESVATGCRAEVILLDLSGVTFCDVAGLRAIDGVAREMEVLGWDVVLYHAPPEMVRLMAMTGVAQRLARH